MVSNAASRAPQLAVVTPHGVLSALLQGLGDLFRLTVPAERERIAYLWWLAALTVAGAFVRFWGLGAVGLHGDEETMAMAVRHILEDGWPILPSGMFYPRGMTQLYLMAASVSLFGESEWALRLPSVLCGAALIPLAYVVGRRFLRAHWNLAFAAVVAFLPDLIVDSQTARMYIFLVAAIMGGMACLFAWERTGRTMWLVAAAAILVIGIDLHALAVASILMFLGPGILQRDLRKLSYGCVAAAFVALGFLVIDGWVNAQYPVPPPEFAAELGPPPWARARATQEFALTFDILLGATGLVIAFFALHVSRVIRVRAAAFASAAALLAGIALQLAVHYHLAALCYVAGVALGVRFGSAAIYRRLALFFAGSAALALIHATLLASAPGSIVKLIGGMVGQPSVWPYVRVAQLSPAAGVLTLALLAWGLYQFARGRRIADYWLYAVLGVWAPVFALGLFAWNVPPRYTEMSLVPMLLCGMAFAQRAADWICAHVARLRGRPRAEIVAAALVTLCMVNPANAARVIGAGYELHPDHKGAAEFMRSQQLTDEDIVLAEDVLQQTYYLGRVDYWLIGKNIARRFVKKHGDGVVDFYTGTPVIASAAMLDDLLQKNPHRRIFVIGSGEQQSDNRLGARGPDLHAELQSDTFKTVFVGRDGLTRVLRAVPGAIELSRSTSEQAEKDADALAIRAEAAEHAAAENKGEVLNVPEAPAPLEPKE